MGKSAKILVLALLTTVTHAYAGSAQENYASTGSPIDGGAVQAPAQQNILPPGYGGNGGVASDSAKKSNGSQLAAQAASVVMAGVMASQCGPKNPMACVMAGMAVAQAASLGGTAAGADRSADYFQNGAGGGGGATNPDGTTGAGSGPTKNGDTGVGASSPQIAAIKKTLDSKGAKLSPDGKTMTLPDGKTVSMASGISDSAASSAGFTQAEIDAGKGTLAEAQAAVAKYKGASMTVDGGGGGGARSPASDSGGGGGSRYGYNYGAGFGMKDPSKKPSLSGMSKNFGTDKIGVSADDIFDMVHRRYKAQDAINGFLKH